MQAPLGRGPLAIAGSFVLPLTAAGIVPALIVGRPDLAGLEPWRALVAGALVAVGLGLLGWTNVLFVRQGRGTLAPWAPTQRLVVRGPYRHVRNPMISGVWLVLLGEAVGARSWGVAAWAGAFFAINHAYFLASEEPGLRARFGEDYVRYCANVPRWVPRLRPWAPGSAVARPG